MTRSPRPAITCRRCGETRKARARGLCHACYTHCWRADTLDQYPPLGPGGTGKGTPRRRHGHYTLAVKERCTCQPCAAYYRSYYDRENKRTTSARRAKGITANPAVSAGVRAARERRQKPGVNPLELGNANRADTVLIDRILAGKPGKAHHPDDRAALVEAHLAGRITKNVAIRAMNCNNDIMDATLIAAAEKAVAA